MGASSAPTGDRRYTDIRTPAALFQTNYLKAGSFRCFRLTNAYVCCCPYAIPPPVRHTRRLTFRYEEYLLGDVGPILITFRHIIHNSLRPFGNLKQSLETQDLRTAPSTSCPELREATASFRGAVQEFGKLLWHPWRSRRSIYVR